MASRTNNQPQEVPTVVLQGAPAGPGTWTIRFVLIATSVAYVSLAGPEHESSLALMLFWGLGSLAWLTGVLGGSSPRALWLVVGAIVLRGLVLAGDPGLSDDVYRYVWEGGLVAEEVSPYADPPDSERLSVYRSRWSEIHASINHPEVSAAYPPVAQWVHALVTTLAGGPSAAPRAIFAMRLFYGAMDLLVLIPLSVLLRRSKVRGASLLAWAWSPLIAIEFAGSAHFDSLGVLCLLSALAVAERASSSGTLHRAGALSLLVLGALVKLIPGLMAPFCARGRRQFLMLALCAAAFAVAWLPFVTGDGRELAAGLTEYGTRWEASSLVYRWIERPLALWFDKDGGLTDPRRMARILVGLVFLTLYVREWRRAPDLIRSAGVLIGAFLVLSPTLHPWYLAWIVPFIALRPSRAWTVLLVLVPLCYWPLAKWKSDQIWIEPAWLWPTLALPFFALLVVDWMLVDSIRARDVD